MTDLAIIDYGVGNLRSVERAFAATGNQATITGDVSVLRHAKGLVLPGVGAFAACMKALSSRGFDELVRERVSGGTPLLGICVGMQLLFEASEEFGDAAGLSLIRGRVRRLPMKGWCLRWAGIKSGNETLIRFCRESKMTRLSILSTRTTATWLIRLWSRVRRTTGLPMLR